MESLNEDSDNWRLTLEELREIKGFENISEEEGERIIDTVVQSALIAFEIDSKVIEE